jgi:pyruvate kinase
LSLFFEDRLPRLGLDDFQLLKTSSRFEQAARQCYLHRGIHPLLFTDAVLPNWEEDMENRIKFAMKCGLDRGFIKNNRIAVVVSGWAQGKSNTTNTMRLVNISG